MEIIIILLLILLNGIFAMSEMSVISARKARLLKEAKEGSKQAQMAIKLANDPDNFLSTIQIGITLIGILTGIYSGDTLAKTFANVLVNIKIPYNYSIIISQTIIVLIVTYLTLIFGELVPKRIALTVSERVAKMVAIPMNYLSKAAYPFVILLSKSSSFIIKILGIKGTKSSVTEEEIKSMIAEGKEGGEVKEVEQNIVERVFFLGDRKIESIMTPRNEIVWIDSNMTSEATIKFIKKNTLDIYPVADGKLDDIIGVVYLKDIFGKLDNEKFKIEKYVKQAQYFHNNMDIYKVLEEMKKNHVEYGLICDEFGSIEGIVTFKDIFEALVGFVETEKENPDIVKRKNGGWLIDGQCPFYDFISYFDMEAEGSKYDYNTISGLILDKLTYVPKEGESVVWNNFSFEIIDMDGARIDKVLVNKIKDSEKYQENK